MDKKFIVLFIALAALAFEAAFWIGKSEKSGPVPLTNWGTTEKVALAQVHPATIMATSTYDSFFNADPVTSTISESVVSAVVPHHLLAGRTEANFFKKLGTQRPEVVVLIGPNHRNAGMSNIITGIQNWRTPYGELQVDTFAVQNLKQNQAAVVQDDILGAEHSIGAVVTFIKKTWPKAKLVPVIVKSIATHTELDALRNELYRLGYGGKKTLVIASVDFSHYQPERVAAFHDELSENVLASGDIPRLKTIEVDSEPSLYFLLSYNKSQSAESFHSVYHTNSATIAGQPDVPETTSHILGYFTSGAPTVKPLTSLQFFGDIMLDRNVAKVMGDEGLDYIFKNLRGQENRFFSGADLFVANLEGPFAPTRIATTKSIAFRFDPALAPQLKKYNFAAFSMANNHSYDMGRANVAFTRDTLAKADLGYFGDELLEGPVYTWIAGDRQVTSTDHHLPYPVAFIGLHNTYHELNMANVKAAMDDAKRRAEAVIVNVHWGEEYTRMSNNKQRTLAHWLIDNGAAAVIGHHPHVVEETEIYKGAPIFYSLGNFVFDQYFSKDTQEGLSVGLTLRDGKVKSIYFFPLQSVRSQVSLMRGAERAGFLDWMNKNSRLDGSSINNGKLILAN